MRFYRWLLHLYPASFREEYRHELCHAFEQRCAECSGLVRVVLALLDVVPNALAAHGEILRQDLRHTARALGRTPGFALTAVAVCALAVGANTAVLSLADFVFLRPLPYADAGRLVKLWQATPGYPQMELSPANYRDWHSMAKSFSAMAAYTESAVNLGGTAEPRRLERVYVTDELLPMLGIEPLHGRIFLAEDFEAGRVVLLSHRLWRAHFGGDPGIVGRTVELDGAPHVVVGVMPPSFQFPSRTTEAWTPAVLPEAAFADRSDNYLDVLARLGPGVTLEEARAELSLVAGQLERQYPKENRDVGASVFGLREEMSQRSRQLLLALCGAGLCILLLACANLASLVLARGAHRVRELAVRSALGAGRERLVRQQVTESLAIALLGGAVGVLAAMLGGPYLAHLVPTALPIGESVPLDLRVLSLSLVLVVVTGLGFGLMPALRAGRSRGLDALRAGGRAAGGRLARLRAALVVVEVAASVALLVSSGLLIRAVWRIQAVDPGFEAAGVLTLETALPQPRYADTDTRADFYDAVLDEVQALPGVESAAYITGLPMLTRGRIWPVSRSGEEVLRESSNTASVRFVTPRYFATLGIPLLRGRDVERSDELDQPFAAVVSASFAARHWPGEDPLGKRFFVAFNERTVVGVAGDVRVRGLEAASEPQVYLPYRQVADGWLLGYCPKDLVVKTALPAPPESLVAAIRRVLAAVDPQQPINRVQTMPAVLEAETASRRGQLFLLGSLAAIALLIAGLGLHGLLAFMVAQRTRELGVRRALGAQAGQVMALVLREGLLLALAGCLLGVVVAALAARGMGALLFGVPPGDPVTLAAAALVCLTTATVGCILPARRAARVDPLHALRAE